MIYLLSLILACSLSAGTISGEVIDHESGAPLPGANVLIHGTKLGASVDISGKFIIENVPNGEHIIRIVYIGYCLQTDTVKIMSNRDLVDRKYSLKYPLIPILESQESKAYHNSISQLPESMSVRIETIEIRNDQVVLEISIKNKRDFDIYLPKNLPCFKVWDIIIHDKNGYRADPLLVGSNCGIQPAPLPQAEDLITIKAHSKITYPDKIYSSSILDNFDRGRYGVRLDYRYSLRRSLGGAHISCGETVEDYKNEIEIMEKFIRGYYVSDNIKYFEID